MTAQRAIVADGRDVAQRPKRAATRSRDGAPSGSLDGCVEQWRKPQRVRPGAAGQPLDELLLQTRCSQFDFVVERQLSQADSTGRCKTLIKCVSRGSVADELRTRTYYTDVQKAVMRERWKQGWTLHQDQHRALAEEELSRVSRKEIRREISSLKKSSTTHRSEIAALKRRVVELERQLRRVGREGQSSRPAAANEGSVSPGTRFSAKRMAAQRKRLGLSASQCGLLIGASGQSVCNWEEGKARPRAQHLPAIFALRNLVRRQANEILEARRAA